MYQEQLSNNLKNEALRKRYLGGETQRAGITGSGTATPKTKEPKMWQNIVRALMLRL